MKICVLALDGAAPQVMFCDEALTNLRRLMDAGVYGLLQSVLPPTRIPAWRCFSASQDPGSLGIYGTRDRSDHSYHQLTPPDAAAGDPLTLAAWLEQKGKKSVVVAENRVHAGNACSNSKEALKEDVLKTSPAHWQEMRARLSGQPWDYFHFVETGLDRVQHAFWNNFDHKHPQFKPGNPHQNVIPEYYRWLDEQIGSVFELIDDQTIVLVVSAYGAQRLDGVFAMNEWLIREGFLVLHEYPSAPLPFENLKVDWSRTSAWCEGARIYFNVQGREPQGVISPRQSDTFRDDLKRRLESLLDDKGQPLQTLTFEPKQIYRHTRNIAPDLLVQLGGWFWRSVSSVGHSQIYLPPDDMDGCNPSEYGTFILAAPNCPLRGEYEGARLLDMAPTLLDLAGYEIPESMQGKSLVAGMEKKAAGGGTDEAEAQRLIHDRLAGLGYI